MFYFKRLIIFTILVIFLGCSNELDTNYETDNINNSKQVAKKFMLSGNVQSTDSNWGNEGEIIEQFPIYIKGLEEVSYYECKVILNGEDAGYILVNVNNTDINVPEYTTNGKTYTEKFREKLDSSDFKIYRYSNFQYTVETTNSRNENVVLYSTGFNKDLENAITKMSNNIKNHGTTIGIDKEILTESNNDESLISRAYDLWDETQLDNNFKKASHLPRWAYSHLYTLYLDEALYLDDTTFAFGKVFAYWARFKGKEDLFDGSSTGGEEIDYFLSSKVLNDLKKLYDYIDGREGAGLQSRVVKLGDFYGYSFECDVDYGLAWGKGEKVFDRIKYKDQPVVIEAPSGFLAVEGVKKKYRVRGNRKKRYYNREMWYLVNPSHKDNSGPGWICSYARFGGSIPEQNITGAYHIWEK